MTAEKYMEMRLRGFDEVSHTDEAAAMRNYQLRKKKRKGLRRNEEASLASVLFPGVSPQEYANKEEVIMYTDLVSSQRTQVPFEYYHLPVCAIPQGAHGHRLRKNLGTYLQGMRLMPAPFVITVGESHGCKPLCMVRMSDRQVKRIRESVQRNYRVHLSLDQLPVLMRNKELNYAVRGYPIGFQAPLGFAGITKEEIYLYNHLDFTITYNNIGNGKVHIVGFDVQPVSFQHKMNDPTAISESGVVETCKDNHNTGVVNHPSTYLKLSAGPSGEEPAVVYSYSVEWIETNQFWTDRWDVYLLGIPDDDIHYFAIANSLILIIVFGGLSLFKVLQTLWKDLQRYKIMPIIEEDDEAAGWTVIYGDVFRPPSTAPILFSSLVGTGIQIGISGIASLLSFMSGVMNPMEKGNILTALLVSYPLSGFVGGYISGWLYRYCDGPAWKPVAQCTALGPPGCLLSLFFIQDLVLCLAGGATASPFSAIVSLMGLCLSCNTALVLLGTYIGFHSDKLKVPTAIHDVARAIPDQPFSNRLSFTASVGGIFPLCCCYEELNLAMNALWRHWFYFDVSFLMPTIVLVAIGCGMVSVLFCFRQFTDQDHRWWWKSFWNSASAGGYLFLYGIWHLWTHTGIDAMLPTVMYMLYMAMISLVFGLFCGAVGTLSAFCFTRALYATLRMESTK